MEDKERDRQFEVPHQLDELHDVIEALHETIVQLRERCSSALDPAMCGKSTEDHKSPTLCPLADHLQKHVRRLREANEAIKLIVETLEL